MPLDCNPVSSSVTPCPTTLEEWARAFCALLPPGFAWEAAEDEDAFMHRRVRAVAHLFQAFNEYACALLPEFVCDTADLTLESWHADYGIPDDCNINDLCTKVTARGDGTCASLQELFDQIATSFGPRSEFGVDLCCEAIPPEIQPGCWDLGCEQMPPQHDLLGGGSELGFASLGACPLSECGSDLGVDVIGDEDEDCNVAGYCETDPAAEAIEPACEQDGCFQWVPSSNSTLIIGCGAPWDISHYVGTAYHLKVGIQGSSPLLRNPGWTQLGECGDSGWEMGCAQLCVPPFDDLICAAERFRHAHIKIVPHYC